MSEKPYAITQVDRRIARARATMSTNHTLLKDCFEGYTVPRTRGVQCLKCLNEWLYARKLIDTEEYREWLRLTETLRTRRGQLAINEAFINIKYLLNVLHARLINKLKAEHKEAERNRRAELAALEEETNSNEFTIDDFCKEFRLGEPNKYF
ncbi:coil containing protein [Vibrio phage 1.253.O._10N.286.45.B12]|nr:coil containing protein [Vibrio phage 1.235.O._10N.261.52.B2]AUR98579.1 coil containing protein [Vibrio phage 1.253.O._10N.286.45.B12]